MAEESLVIICTKSIFLCVFMVIAVVGNGSVLYAIRKYKKLKTVPNFFVFNLAIADLLFAITGMPMILITTIAGKWILGDVMCEIGGLLNSLFCTTSIWTLVMISVHRYFAVAKASNVKMIYTEKRTYIIIICIWVYAFLISVPPIFGWSQFSEGSNFCTVDGKKDMIYSIFLLMTDYFIPFLFLTGLYLKIFFLLRSHDSFMKKSRSSTSIINNDTEIAKEIYSTGPSSEYEQKKSVPNADEYTTIHKAIIAVDKTITSLLVTESNDQIAQTAITGIVDNGNTENNNRPHRKENGKRHISFSADSDNDVNKISSPAQLTRNKRKSSSKRRKSFFKEVRVTKMLLIVICGFFLCWTPFLIASILYAFNMAPSDFKLLTLGIMLACTNSIINPIIYALMNKNFRFAFKSMYASTKLFFYNFKLN